MDFSTKDLPSTSDFEKSGFEEFDPTKAVQTVTMTKEIIQKLAKLLKIEVKIYENGVRFASIKLPYKLDNPTHESDYSIQEFSPSTRVQNLELIHQTLNKYNADVRKRHTSFIHQIPANLKMTRAFFPLQRGKSENINLLELGSPKKFKREDEEIGDSFFMNKNVSNESFKNSNFVNFNNVNSNNITSNDFFKEKSNTVIYKCSSPSKNKERISKGDVFGFVLKNEHIGFSNLKDNNFLNIDVIKEKEESQYFNQNLIRSQKNFDSNSSANSSRKEEDGEIKFKRKNTVIGFKTTNKQMTFDAIKPVKYYNKDSNKNLSVFNNLKNKTVKQEPTLLHQSTYSPCNSTINKESLSILDKIKSKMSLKNPEIKITLEPSEPPIEPGSSSIKSTNKFNQSAQRALQHSNTTKSHVTSLQVPDSPYDRKQTQSKTQPPTESNNDKDKFSPQSNNSSNSENPLEQLEQLVKKSVSQKHEYPLVSVAVRNSANSAERIKVCGCKDVLIVEDELFNMQTLHSIMKKNNVDADEAYNGKLCIDAINDKKKTECNTCNKNEYKLILMDIMMPEMDGLEASRRIQLMVDKGDLNKDVKIIIISAQENESIRSMISKIPIIKEFVPKPVKKLKLEEILNKFYFTQELIL